MGRWVTIVRRENLQGRHRSRRPPTLARRAPAGQVTANAYGHCQGRSASSAEGAVPCSARGAGQQLNRRTARRAATLHVEGKHRAVRLTFRRGLARYRGQRDLFHRRTTGGCRRCSRTRAPARDAAAAPTTLLQLQHKCTWSCWGKDATYRVVKTNPRRPGRIET